MAARAPNLGTSHDLFRLEWKSSLAEGENWGNTIKKSDYIFRIPRL